MIRKSGQDNLEPPGTPLAKPVVADLQRRILDRKLAPGDRLPAVRELARQHRVSYSVALRAVEHLERAGLVERFQGSGTYVKASNPGPRRSSPALAPGNAQPWVSLFLDLRQHVVGNLNTALMIELCGSHFVSAATINPSSVMGQTQWKKMAQMWRRNPPAAVVSTSSTVQFENLVHRYCPPTARFILIMLPALAYPGWHSVCPDFAAAGRLAAEHLIRQGHRRIGILTRRRTLVLNWRQTFRKAAMPSTHLILGAGQIIRDAGLHAGLTIHYNGMAGNDPSGIPTDEANVAAMTRWITGPRAPTAVIADDFRVPGLHAAAQRAGRRLGDDLPVIPVGGGCLAGYVDWPRVDLRFDVVAEQTAALIKADDRDLRDGVRHVLVPPLFLPPGTHSPIKRELHT